MDTIKLTRADRERIVDKHRFMANEISRLQERFGYEPVFRRINRIRRAAFMRWLHNRG